MTSRLLHECNCMAVCKSGKHCPSFVTPPKPGDPSSASLDDVPHVFDRATELRQWVSRSASPGAGETHLAARDGCREAVLADGDLFVDERVGKVVLPTVSGGLRMETGAGAHLSMGHGADKDDDALGFGYRREVFRQLDGSRVKREGDLVGVEGEVVADRVLGSSCQSEAQEESGPRSGP